jgi:hypothetical protein
MSLHHLTHLVHGALHEKEHPKFAGAVLVGVGLILTPFLIGIPILLVGIYKLSQ